MSSAVRRNAPCPPPDAHASRPDHLRVVPSPRPRPRRRPRIGSLPLVTVAVLAAGFCGLIAINTRTAQDAFTLHGLQLQAALLVEQERAAEAAAVAASSPERLAAAAHRLGMHAATTVRYVRVPTTPPSAAPLALPALPGTPLAHGPGPRRPRPPVPLPAAPPPPVPAAPVPAAAVPAAGVPTGLTADATVPLHEG